MKQSTGALNIVPAGKLPFDFFVIGDAEVLFKAGKTEEGNKIINDVMKYAKEYLELCNSNGSLVCVSEWIIP